ncbi:MAG: CHASE domain-containing protein, partial [Candidatus Omnitrophota bacterium]
MDSTVRVSAPEAGQASPMYFSTIACGIFALMLGMMVMVGWYTHNPKLVQVHANLYPMQYNTALGFILCGFGLVVSRLGRFLFPRAAGAMAALLGILTLAEYLFGVNLGIDELFMASPMMIESSHAGRMAPNAAAGFVLMGAALMLIAPEFSDRAKSLRRLWIQGTLGMLTMALGGVGVFNALFNIRFSFGLSYWPSMAILTAAGFIILGVGLVAFSWRKGDSHLPIALVLIFGTMLSFTGYFALSNIEEQSSISDFRYESQDRFALFKEKMDSYLDWVRALWAFYESSEAVERDEFYRFTKSCFENAKGRYSLAWIPYLEESKREAFEKRAREEGNPDFKVLEMDAHGNPLVAPGRKEYFPIHYMEPVETQFLPVGFNMASLPPVMKALREARDTGNMVATGRVGFNYRRARQEFFFFAVRPVYSKGVIEDSIAWRRGHLLGFTAGIFRVGDLIEGILGSLRVSQTDILLYDKSASLGERFLYQHRSGEEAVDTVPVPEDHLSRLTGLYYANTVDVAGRKWLFVSLPSAGRFASQSTWLPWAAFFTVLYVSLLLAYYLWGSRQHTVMIENAVKLRTAEWREANEALKYQIEERQKADDKLREMTAAMENAVEGIAQLDGEGKYTYVNKAYAV